MLPRSDRLFLIVAARKDPHRSGGTVPIQEPSAALSQRADQLHVVQNVPESGWRYLTARQQVQEFQRIVGRHYHVMDFLPFLTSVGMIQDHLKTEFAGTFFGDQVGPPGYTFSRK